MCDLCTIDMLGDRLVSCENPALKKQAQICYICSGNLNKLIEVINTDIQEVVELVVIMQKALKFQGIKDVHIEDRIASVLSQYAEMLAAEGDLEAALNYLGDSKEQRVSMLRERLCKALGYIQEQRHITKPVTQNYYYDQSRKISQSSQNNPYNNPLQQSLQQPLPQTTPVQNWNTNPLKQSYGAAANQFAQPSQQFGIPPPPQAQSTIYDQYSTYNQVPAAQPPPPPPPTSGSSLSGSRPSSVGPQSRSKYLIDPSVKSTSSYGQTGFPPANSLYNSQQMTPIPGYASQNIYQPQIPMSGNIYASQPSSFMSAPKEPESYKSLQPNVMPPLQNVPLQNPPLQNPPLQNIPLQNVPLQNVPLQNTSQPQIYDPIRTQSTSQTPTYGNGNIYQLPPQSSGWNDPPIGKSPKMQVNHRLYLIIFVSFDR